MLSNRARYSSELPSAASARRAAMGGRSLFSVCLLLLGLREIFDYADRIAMSNSMRLRAVSFVISKNAKRSRRVRRRRRRRTGRAERCDISAAGRGRCAAGPHR